MKKRKKVTRANLVPKLLTHQPVEIVIALNFGIVARHTLQMNLQNTKVTDLSHVDDSISRTSLKNYLDGWYGNAISKGVVFYDY